MINNITNYLYNCIPNDSPLYDSLFKGRRELGLPSLADYILDETAGESCLSKEAAWDSVCNAMEYYLLDYKGSNVEKERLWQLLSDWLYSFSNELGREDGYDDIKQLLPRPIERDLSIEIIKDLHFSKSGISKSELAAKYNVSERTIKDIINKIDVSCRDSQLRIAGQHVTGKVRHVDLCESQGYGSAGNRYRYFSLGSTINPIFLQMNIAQVHSLINGLKCSYYSEERNMSITSAIEIWSQLSAYTRERIKLVYCREDEQLEEFLMIVEDEMRAGSLGSYYSEREQLNEEDLSDDEIREIERKLEN